MVRPLLTSIFAVEKLKILLNVHPKAILVGGLSLAFWAQKYNVNPHEDFAGITKDIDFYGQAELATFHAKNLKAIFPQLFLNENSQY